MIYKELNGKPMTQQQLEAYLVRIHMEAPVQPDLEYLTRLQMAHASHIPFENLDMMHGIPVTLDREALFDKLITRRRGGVCSELNTLYNWLLETLGYEVESYSSRIIALTAPLQAKSHRLMGVKLDGRTYITDVGMNFETHRIPLLLEDGLEQDDGECVYKLARDEFFGWILWQHRPGRGWRRKLGFTEDPVIDLDFVAPTMFAQYHEASRINKHTKVSLYIDGQFQALRAGQYIHEHHGIEEVICEVESPEQETRILEEVFGLTI